MKSRGAYPAEHVARLWNMKGANKEFTNLFRNSNVGEEIQISLKQFKHGV
jgi:hypothetical protein